MFLGCGQRDAVRTRNVARETIERPIRPQPEDASRGIDNAGLALIREIEVAVRGEVEIVEALEALAEGGFEDGLELAGLGIEDQEPLLVIGDERAAILVELQAVRPAVVLDDELPLLLRRNPEDAAKGDVHAPQVALPVERRGLEKALNLRALAVRVGPGAAALVAELLWNGGIDLRLDQFELLEGIEHVRDRE